jgi:nucleoside-diphosphate-sugar epimerase
MIFRPQRTAIVGATGPTGVHLARELVRRGWAVRVVSRSQQRLDQMFAGLAVERTAADALDLEATRRAVDGCDLVVDCIGLPPERMDDHLSTAEILASAAGASGARCLQVSSYWAFMPTDRMILDESCPRTGDHPWYRPRREAEDILLGAGAAVAHLPDFFGPHVHTSSVQNALVQAADDRAMQWLGSAATARETVYVPDAMRIVADLAERDEAYGTDWGLPGNGVVSAADLAALASAHLGRPVKIQAARPWMMRLIAAFSKDVRTILPMVDGYARPVRYDTSKIRGLLGEITLTPLDRAVGDTLDWIRDSRATA